MFINSSLALFLFVEFQSFQLTSFSNHLWNLESMPFPLEHSRTSQLRPSYRLPFSKPFHLFYLAHLRDFRAHLDVNHCSFLKIKLLKILDCFGYHRYLYWFYDLSFRLHLLCLSFQSAKCFLSLNYFSFHFIHILSFLNKKN